MLKGKCMSEPNFMATHPDNLLKILKPLVVVRKHRSRVFSFRCDTTCLKSSLLCSEAHLVLDSWLEVPQKGVGFVVLHLPVLHRATAQEIIQLRGKDGSRSTLILRTLVPCRKRDKIVFSPVSFQTLIASHRWSWIKFLTLFYISRAAL